MFLAKIRKIIQSKYIWLFFCQILILFVSLKNVFPAGYIFAGGDITQYFNLSHIVNGLTYTWSNLSGEGFFLQFFSYSLYYSVIYFFKTLFHLSNSSQSFFYFLLFLSGSFWSFYLSSKVYFGKWSNNNFYRIGFALLYTFNFYTLNSFYFIWGYSPFLTLYTLVPAIFGLSYKYFSSEKINWLVLFLLSVPFFLSNIANGNMAFFVTLNIFLFLFISLMFFFSEPRIKPVSYLKRTAIFYVFYFLCVCWSVLPQIFELLRMAGNTKGGGSIFDIRAWIIWQSIRFPDIFFLVPHLQDFISTKIFLGAVLFFVLIVMIAYSYTRTQFKTSKISLIFLILLIVGIFLENKGVGILNSGITIAIFNNTLLGALRSNDKVFSILPFLIIILVFIQFRSKPYYNYLAAVLVLLTLTFSFPFFTGSLQTKYSSAFTNGENYLTSKGSFIHIIPDEYYKAAALLNQRFLDSKIFRAPYNVLNSPGWVNFIKWKVAGVDPTTQLFNDPAVEMNGYGAFGDWNYGQLWSKQSTSDSVWLLPLTGYLNTKYLIYHKDIAQKFITETEGKISDYEKDGYISKISENDYFNLYKIADHYYLPHVYVPTQSITSGKKISEMPAILKSDNLSDRSALFLTAQNQGKDLTGIPTNLKEAPTVEYKKINPTKYRIFIHNSTTTFPLILSESFHDGWQVFQSNGVSFTSNGDLNKELQGYSAFSDNSDDQATKAELSNYIKLGDISTFGDGKEKELQSHIWNDGKETTKNVGRYTIDFISKDIKGTIQNNNLKAGSIAETWFKKPVILSFQHFVANGYSNGWLINTKEICQNNSQCRKNSDESYDLELVIAFGPQRLYYLSLWISSVVLFGSLVVMITVYFKRRMKK